MYLPVPPHAQFQSTHPARGATTAQHRVRQHEFHFNPRTPRGVRLFQLGYLLPLIQFQSTHPARGATFLYPHPVSNHLVFQSTHPARGATSQHHFLCFSMAISIHAPREGCDKQSLVQIVYLYYFNPRTPRGVRPGRGVCNFISNKISIHAPREGCDTPALVKAFYDYNFNPRTPRGVRLVRGLG